MKFDDKDEKSQEEKLSDSAEKSASLPAVSTLQNRLRNPSLSPSHEVLDLVRDIDNAPSEEGTALVLAVAERVFAQHGEKRPIHQDCDLEVLCLSHLFRHGVSQAEGVARVAMHSEDADVKAHGYLIVCDSQQGSIVKEMLRHIEPPFKATVLSTFIYSGNERLSDLAKAVLSECYTGDVSVIKAA